MIVFRDINPSAPTHLLAIPRRHLASVDDLTDARSVATCWRPCLAPCAASPRTRG